MVNPLVSVLIPQWGKTDLTVRAVSSVRRSDYEGVVEIIVFDNGSPGGPGDIALSSDIVLIESETNLGFSEAHNRMAATASGEYLLLLNNDTMLAPSCLRKLVEVAEGDREIGLVSPRYLNFDGRTLESGGFVGTGGDGWQLFRDGAVPDSMRTGVYHADYGSAAALLVRSDLFDELGGFDPLFSPAYYEDTDLAMRATSGGSRCVVVPSAVCFHYEGATGGTDLGSGMKKYQAEHKVLFADRWADTLESHDDVSFRSALSAALFGRSDRLKVLWLAPHLPQVDREAGHLRMMKMIAALRKGGHDVAFWAENANDRARYGPLLEEAGVRWFGRPSDERWRIPSEDPFFGTLEDVLGASTWDVVVASFPDFFDRLEQRIRRVAVGATVIVDSPDLHYLRHNRALAAGEEVVGTMGEERELGIYSRSDGVIASADYEAVELAEKLVDTPVFAYAVSAEAPRLEGHDVPHGERDIVLFLGNASHRPNIDAIRWWQSEIGPSCVTSDGDPLLLTVVGNGTDVFADEWRDAHSPVDALGWVADLGPLLDRTRVFVVPLRYGAGTKGKITQAIGRGVPVVTTSVGAEGFDDDLVSCLRVVDEPSEFASAVLGLIEDDREWSDAADQISRHASRMWGTQQKVDAALVSWMSGVSNADLHRNGADLTF